MDHYSDDSVFKNKNEKKKNKGVFLLDEQQ